MYKSLLIFILFLALASCENSSNKNKLFNTIYNKFPVRKVKISTNGHFISYLSPINKHYNLFIKDLYSDSTFQITFLEDQDILEQNWINDSIIGYSYQNKEKDRYVYAFYNLNQNRERHFTNINQYNFLSPSNEHSNTCLFSNGFSIMQVSLDKIRYNLYTPKSARDNNQLKYKQHWLANSKNEVLICTETVDTLHYVLFRKNTKPNDSLSVLFSFNAFEYFEPLYFDQTDTIFYALSNIGRDKIALIKYDPVKNLELGCIYEDTEFDLLKAYYSYADKSVTHMLYHSTKFKNYFLNKNNYGFYETLGKDTTKYSLEMVSLTKDGSKQIWYADNCSSYKFFIYDCVKGTTELFKEYSPWPQNQEPVTTAFEYRTRDTLNITGYITMPANIRKPPLIVIPHGGPFNASDKYEFNRDIQYFAGLGYAVLQINFRGSSGKGKAFSMKGKKQWGSGMLCDILEGIKFIQGKDIVDNDNIAVVGISYGGYVALALPGMEENLIKCAVSVSGVTDMTAHIAHIDTTFNGNENWIREMIGDLTKDSLLLRSISPYFKSERINIPIFLIHGKDDQTVLYTQSEKMFQILKEQKKEAHLMLIDNAGHGNFSDLQRKKILMRVESFLSEHLSRTL